jgi:Triose-phosphate Transporter family
MPVARIERGPAITASCKLDHSCVIAAPHERVLTRSARARRYLGHVLPIGLLFAAVLWLGNEAYLHLSVSFIQMLKASMPVAVFSVGVLLGTNAYSHKSAANMVVIGFGIALASYGEVHFVLLGVALQLASIFCESFRLVLIQVSGH